MRGWVGGGGGGRSKPKRSMQLCGIDVFSDKIKVDWRRKVTYYFILFF